LRGPDGLETLAWTLPKEVFFVVRTAASSTVWARALDHGQPKAA
jgi:hypothetical protein